VLTHSLTGSLQIELTRRESVTRAIVASPLVKHLFIAALQMPGVRRQASLVGASKESAVQKDGRDALWASIVAVCAVTGTLGVLFLPLVLN
jgi:hypothetical protein